MLKLTSTSVLPPASAEVPSLGLLGSCFKTTVIEPSVAGVSKNNEVSRPTGFPLPSTSVLSITKLQEVQSREEV